MAITYVDHPAAAGQTDFTFTFDYLEDEHVKVEINGVDTTAFVVIVESNGDKKIRLTTPTVGGESVRVKRRSAPNQNLVDFVNGSVLTESELDLAYRHNRYLSEEIAELNDQSLQKEAGGTEWDALGLRIQNVGTATATTDAVTKVYLDNKVAQVSSGATQPPLKWVFSAISGTNNTYTVTGAEVLGDTAYEVSINGLIKEPTVEYTVNPDTNTLTIIPSMTGGEDIVVIQRGFGVAVTGTVGANSLVDGSVTNAKLANGAVTSDKISTTDTNFNVQSDGKVGIGTASPTSNLTIQDNTNAKLELKTQSKIATLDVTNTNTTLTFATGDNFLIKQDSTEYFKIENNGNIGIRNNNPAHALDVTGDLNITGDYKVNGTNLTTVPTGTVSAFAGSTAPTGYALCDGSAVNRTTQAALFAVIGTTYGVGDGSTTFNLPDLRGRVVAGLGGSLLSGTDALSDTGGAKEHTLSTAEMPSHSHTFDGGGLKSLAGDTAGTDDYASSGGTTNATGGGQAHNNVQPTIILNYIIKT